MKKILLIILLICTACSAPKPELEHTALFSKADLSLMFATDIHYLDPSLHVEGALFDEVIANGDGKVVHYADQLLEAFIAEVLRVKPDVLFLTGDLTFNGEKKSHQVLADKLSILEEAGIFVYVIPGNHDINNPRSRGYGEKETYKTPAISTKDFASIYADYGYRSGQSVREPGTLSYLVKLSDTQWMFMLDSNNNTQPDGKSTDISGAIPDTTLAWMDALIESNKTENLNIMVSMHHNLYRHSDMINDGFTLDNAKAVGDFFNLHKIKAVFSGHIHIQSIVEKPTSDVREFVTGSLSVSPNNYGLVDVNSDVLTYQSHGLNFTMRDGLDFLSVSRQYFLDVAYGKVISGMSESNLNEQEIKDLATVFSELNRYYFAGLVVPEPERYLSHSGYRVILDKGVYLDYLNDILENITDSNHLTVDLK